MLNAPVAEQAIAAFAIGLSVAGYKAGLKQPDCLIIWVCLFLGGPPHNGGFPLSFP